MADHLYREICRNPEDDTLRLVYADWLDDNDGHDRAEFIRVQTKLARETFDGRPGFEYRDTLLRCEQFYPAAHPEWARLPCEACGGRTWGTVNLGEFEEYATCQACSGTGDLFAARDEQAPGHVHLTPRTVTFDRGFPAAVTCEMAEAFDMHGTPTLWACAVVRRTPVTRFVLTDADPPGRDSGDNDYPFYWRDTMFTHGSGYVIADQCDRNYRTLERALDVFALAAGRLVRQHVYGEAKT